MDFNIILGSLSNKSLNLELEKIFKELIKLDSKDSLNINKIRFYSFELGLNKITKRVLFTLQLNEINDLTILNKNDLIQGLNGYHDLMIKSMKMDSTLDDTIYLELIF